MLPDLDTLKMVRGHVKQEIENRQAELKDCQYQGVHRAGISAAIATLTELEKWLTAQIDQTTITLTKFGGMTP